MKRSRKILALALAGSICVSGMTVSAAGTAADGDVELPEALYEFTMDEIKDGVGRTGVHDGFGCG